MTATPMFVSDRSTLLTRLKLDGATVAGSLAEIDTAIQEVAVGFFRRLGASRIAAVKAITYTDTPATSDDYLRLLASLTEINWVRAKLLRVKPTLFMDASGKALQIWNDEGAFRPNSAKAIDAELADLSHKIEDGLLALENGVGTLTTEINATTFQPAATPDLPGASAFPARRNPANRGFWTQGGPFSTGGFAP